MSLNWKSSGNYMPNFIMKCFNAMYILCPALRPVAKTHRNSIHLSKIQNYKLYLICIEFISINRNLFWWFFGNDNFGWFSFSQIISFALSKFIMGYKCLHFPFYSFELQVNSITRKLIFLCILISKFDKWVRIRAIVIFCFMKN
jgi:hypothetical protein